MPVISINGLNKSFGATPILRNIGCFVHEGDKIALVGRNGTGKTTLVRIISGLEDYDSGDVAIARGAKLGYLSQTPVEELSLSLMEFASEAFSDIEALERELEELTGSMAHLPPGSFELKEAIRRYDRLLAHISAKEGFDRDYRIRAALFGLGFSEDDLGRKLGTFSGGQLMRASLAKLLLSEPDLMLLDEPTNHLDLPSTEWLEGYLRSYKGSMILVSHDRYFLEAVVDHVWEIEGLELKAYEGGYEDFVAQKEFNLKHQMDEFARQQEYMEKLKDYIRRYKAGNRTTMAQSREKMLARVKAHAVNKPGRQAEMSIRFGEVTRTGKYAITATGLSKAYGSLRLFKGLDLHVERGERLGIVGPNGSGKTTLIRILAGDIEPDSGEVRPGVNMKKAVFYQDIKGLDNEKSVLDHIYMKKPWTIGQARDYLARFLFRGDEVYKLAGDLSGGEKNRLLISMMLLDEPNLIVLDEPTNHLDIASRHALEEALLSFDGTVISASHDRYFLDRIATSILAVDGGKAQLYGGNYTFYRQESEKRAASFHKEAPKKAEQRQDLGRNRSREERRTRERMASLIAQAEAEIHRMEAELGEADARLADPETYADADTAIKEQKRRDELAQRINAAYERWHELQAMAEQGDIGLQ